jgi:pilus assembly protein CpaB
VLATSASGSEGSQAAKISWVTLAVEPERVEEYVSASQQMELYFTLPAVEPQVGSQESAQAEAETDEAAQADAGNKGGAEDE